MENELNQNYYARWLKTEELLNNSNKISVIGAPNEVVSAGLPIGQIGDKLLLDTDTGHNLVIGSTGSGKTQATVLPMLYSIALAGESLVIKDVKGELYQMTSNLYREKGYEVIAINFENPEYGYGWNPFALPKKLYDLGMKDEALRLLTEISNLMMYENNKNTDPFWSNTASGCITGLALSLFEKADEEEINLASISKLTTLSEDEEKDMLDAYISNLDKNSPAYKCLASTYLAPQETKYSILSVLNQKLSDYTNNFGLTNLLADNDLDLLNINNKKIVIYLITSGDQTNVSNIFSNIFIKQCQHVFNRNKRDEVVNFIIDDFDDGEVPIYNLVNMLNSSRGNKIRFTLLVKSFHKLKELYGVDNFELIKDSCTNIMYLLTADFETAEDISVLCGMKDKDNRLVSVEALRRLSMWQTVIIKRRMMPYFTKLIPFYQMNISLDNGAEMERRINKDIKIFNLEKYFE